jgi:hypothetical protein
MSPDGVLKQNDQNTRIVDTGWDIRLTGPQNVSGAVGDLEYLAWPYGVAVSAFHYHQSQGSNHFVQSVLSFLPATLYFIVGFHQMAADKQTSTSIPHSSSSAVPSRRISTLKSIVRNPCR